MFLIVRQKGGHQAIPIRPEDRWDFHKVLPGRTEVRIVLRVRGRRYLLYSTCTLSKQYPKLKRPQLTLLCDEIITMLSEQISCGQEYINFERVAGTVELRHRRRWVANGLIPMGSMAEYQGHPIDPKAEILATRVQVDVSDIILMDHEPPIDVEVEQEELPY
jgi:hypothetical protein